MPLVAQKHLKAMLRSEHGLNPLYRYEVLISIRLGPMYDVDEHLDSRRQMC